MTGRLHIEFGKPGAGWLRMGLTAGEARFEAHISCTPNDFLHELAAALSLALQGVDGAALAHCEPITYEFRFSVAHLDEQVHLQILEHPTWQPLKDTAQLALSCHDDAHAIVLPFWRALRRLEVDFDEAAWQRKFPSTAMERVSHLLSSARDK